MHSAQSGFWGIDLGVGRAGRSTVRPMDAKDLLKQIAAAGESRMRTVLAERFGQLADDIDEGIISQLAQLSSAAALAGDEAALGRVAAAAQSLVASQRREIVGDLAAVVNAAALDIFGALAAGARAVETEVAP